MVVFNAITCCRYSDNVMECLSFEVRRINSLDEVTAGDCSHGIVNGQLQLPRAKLTQGIKTGKPQPG